MDFEGDVTYLLGVYCNEFFQSKGKFSWRDFEAIVTSGHIYWLIGRVQDAA